MKRVFKHTGLLVLISVFLMSTSGFSLIHHICHSCGLHKTHISMISLMENDKCMEHESHSESKTTCSCQGGICENSHKQCSGDKEDYGKPEHEFYKLYSPFEYSKIDYNISAQSLNLLFDFFQFDSATALFAEKLSFQDSSPPIVLYDRDICVCISSFRI